LPRQKSGDDGVEAGNFGFATEVQHHFRPKHDFGEYGDEGPLPSNAEGGSVRVTIQSVGIGRIGLMLANGDTKLLLTVRLVKFSDAGNKPFACHNDPEHHVLR